MDEKVKDICFTRVELQKNRTGIVKIFRPDLTFFCINCRQITVVLLSNSLTYPNNARRASSTFLTGWRLMLCLWGLTALRL